MHRLPGFDYKSPFFYMVTLKRRKGLAALSEIGPGGLIGNRLTRAFEAVIRGFPAKWRCCEAISPFVVMPDHLHLLIKIRDTPDRVALGVLVSQLAKALRNAYWQTVAADAATGKTRAPGFAESASPSAEKKPSIAKGEGIVGGESIVGCEGIAGCEGFAGCKGFAGGEGFAGCASAQPRGLSRETPLLQPRGLCREVFERDWHDWIVKKEGQLAAFRRYIRENAARAWKRRAHAQYFGHVSEIAFLGRRWFAYGNRALLDLPVLVPFKGHRATAEGSREWNALLTAAGRIGPGGAGVSTFMSPLEKACGNAIARAGGRLIVLSSEGFGPRWHPSREKERFCAQGRMLFLSLYEATPRQPTRAELYHRCHEMIDLALTGLA